MICRSGSPLSLAAFLADRYVPAHPGLADSSARQYGLAVAVYSKWLGHPATMADLTTDLLRGFLADLATRRKPSTVNSKRNHLLALWRFCWDESACTEAPRRIHRLPENLAAPQAWRVDEVSAILSAAKALSGDVAGVPKAGWWCSLFLVAYDSGARWGSLRGVQPGHVDLGRRTVRLVSDHDKTHREFIADLAMDTVAQITTIWNPHGGLLWPWPWSDEHFRSALSAILKTAGVTFGRGAGGLLHKMRRTSGSLVEGAGGAGDKHLHNSRAVFLKHYLDPRLGSHSQLGLLPRPAF